MGSGEVAIVALSTMISLKVTFSDGLGGGWPLVANHPLRVCVDVLLLEYALCHHGLGHLQEAGYIGTLHIVDVAIGLRAIFHTFGVNLVHDAMQLGVDLLAAPLQAL